MKYIVPLVLFMFIITSCSEDEEKDLLGTWSYEIISLNGKTSQYMHVENCQKDYFKFSVNNSFNMYEEFKTDPCEDCGDCPVIGTVREWELEGLNLELYMSKPTPSIQYTIISVNEDTLRYSYKTDYDKDGTIDHVEITAHRYIPN